MLNLLASTFKDKSFFVQMLCSDDVSSNVCPGTSQWSLVSNSRRQNEPGLGWSDIIITCVVTSTRSHFLVHIWLF